MNIVKLTINNKYEKLKIGDRLIISKKLSPAFNFLKIGDIMVVSAPVKKSLFIRCDDCPSNNFCFKIALESNPEFTAVSCYFEFKNINGVDML